MSEIGPKSPRFITFEGLDGSGKSTHLQRLVEVLAGCGMGHVVTHEPGGTPLGDGLRSVFLDKRWAALDGTVELLVVFASRRQHLLEVIDPALERGDIVLCDRFTDSTRAYQGGGRGVPDELIDQVDQLSTGGRVPDLTILFDLPAEVARQRGHGDRHADGTADRLDAEALDFYRRVRERFLSLARAEPDRFRVIDSSGSLAATERQVFAALAGVLPVASERAQRDGPR